MKIFKYLAIRYKPNKKRTDAFAEDLRSVGRAVLIGGLITLFAPASIDLSALIVMLVGGIIWNTGLLIIR